MLTAAHSCCGLIPRCSGDTCGGWQGQTLGGEGGVRVLLLLCRTFHPSISGGKIRLLCAGNGNASKKTGTCQGLPLLFSIDTCQESACKIKSLPQSGLLLHFFSDFAEVVRCADTAELPQASEGGGPRPAAAFGGLKAMNTLGGERWCWRRG